MAKALGVLFVIVSACSGKGEFIPTPAPAPDPTTTTPELTLAVREPDPTTSTTELVAVVAPSRNLQPVATTLVGALTPLPYNGWAIPEYIVSCETGGTFSWTAYNRSGASGPYQIMPEHFGGELAMNQSHEAQHAMAAKLWNGGKGKGNWSACL